MSDSSDHIEAEWQFDTDDLKRVEHWLRDLPEGMRFTVVASHPVDHIDTYVDTKDWRIYQSGYALRLRRSRGRAELTLKALAGDHGALVQRREATQQLPDADIEEVDQLRGPVGDRVMSIRGPISTSPLFTVITMRQPYGLWFAGEEIGEVVLDNATFIGESFEDQTQIMRVEVETTNEHVDCLEPFIAAMVEACSLRAAGGSKFEIGLRMLGRSPSTAPDFGPTAVTRASSIADLALAVLRRNFGELLRHEPGTRLGDDLEELHDMRVAARRMRAALALFSSYLTPDYEIMRGELGWLAEALGNVRDLDVQLDQIRGWQRELDASEADALNPLIDELNRRRSGAREQMLSALDSDRYTELVSEFSELLRAGLGDIEPEAAVAVVPALVRRRIRRFRRLADRLGDSSRDADFHQARIEGKRLRYAFEFVSPLYGKAATGLSQRMVAVQDVLGRHQDACVAIDHLRELSETSSSLPSPTVFVMGRLAERYAAEAAQSRTQFAKAYAAISGKRLRRMERAMRRRSRPKRASRLPAARDGKPANLNAEDIDAS